MRYFRIEELRQLQKDENIRWLVEEWVRLPEGYEGERRPWVCVLVANGTYGNTLTMWMMLTTQHKAGRPPVDFKPTFGRAMPRSYLNDGGSVIVLDARRIPEISYLPHWECQDSPARLTDRAAIRAYKFICERGSANTASPLHVDNFSYCTAWLQANLPNAVRALGTRLQDAGKESDEMLSLAKTMQHLVVHWDITSKREQKRCRNAIMYGRTQQTQEEQPRGRTQH
jgi:hypothetical protein